ncbi:competence protein [Virgibacillus dokdonensis]|uniref:Competence protein n=2 Tax=Virgibacillus TaxID=84406 RepID=A0A3E0WV37_9BACI|nr:MULTISPECIES: competence protein ComK [Virgibacillus]NWO12875.1 competence protein ComK [Virgibacillus sp.]RFA36688.1 competence protein [Virgibacillus dokdonensis]SHH60491.1 competence protein ComK [Virgibacillus chiguensis]
MKQRITSLYVISPHTKAIYRNEHSYYRSRIMESGRAEKMSIHKPEQILDNSCLIYGSSLEGRRLAVKDILDSSSKLPVPVIPDKGVFMMPTASVKNKNNVWLTYHHIYGFEENKSGTYVTFFDGSGIQLDISMNTFDLQYKRTSQVIVHLNRTFLFGQSKFPIPRSRLKRL